MKPNLGICFSSRRRAFSQDPAAHFLKNMFRVPCSRDGHDAVRLQAFLRAIVQAGATSAMTSSSCNSELTSPK